MSAAAQPTELYNDTEKLLIKKICSLKSLIYNIHHNHQIHLLAYFTYELATLFHQYYNQQRVLDAQNPAATAHRLYLVNIVQQTLQSSLFLMGITPLQSM